MQEYLVLQLRKLFYYKNTDDLVELLMKANIQLTLTYCV